MRGHFEDQGKLFSYVSPEQRVPADHPLRAVRTIVRFVLHKLHGDFGKIYSEAGRPSIPPEQLLSALLLQALYGIRSERQLMEQLDYNLLYRWFVGLAFDDAVWVATSFTKNRERLQQADIFCRFMAELLKHPDVKPLLSSEHFSVDGTLIEASFEQAGLRSAVSNRRTALAAMAQISTSRSVRTRPTRVSPILTADFIKRPRAGNRSSATWAMR